MRNKTCSKCKIEKSLKHYHKHRETKDGFQTICKKCYEGYRLKKTNYKEGYFDANQHRKDWKI